jgi:hypothetical protein
VADFFERGEVAEGRETGSGGGGGWGCGWICRRRRLMCWVWIARAGRYSAQQQSAGAGARTYALQPISSSVPNPSASGPRMHDYAIRASGAGALAMQVAPGLLGVRISVVATSHALIGGFSVATSASASVPLSVSRPVSGASSSRRSDSKSATSTTSSASAR